MYRKKIIYNLIILNLIIILILMLGRISILSKFINVVCNIVVIPVIFGVFLFYILKPLNKLFLRKNIKDGRAAFLTLVIFFFIMAGITKYFSDYIINQFIMLRDMLLQIIEERNLVAEMNSIVTESLSNTDYYGKFIGNLQSYIVLIGSNAKKLFDTGMMFFSNILLVILVVFYLLKDGEKVSEYILRFTPHKYGKDMDITIEECDKVLSTYILGQGTVALVLAIMVYCGYKIISMPSPLFLATITFVLAFIPFIGFLISMIIPYIIAITLGMPMIIKLTVIFILAQTLKGRIIVPLIMGKAMKIHPLTDIFLVVGAASLIGPMGAFVIIPIYAIAKVLYRNFEKYIKDKMNNEKLE